MARTSTFTVVTKKGDPAFVRLFQKEEDALAWTGPEYDKKGYVVQTFQKKTETYFELVDDHQDGMALDRTETGAKINDTVEEFD